MRNGLAVLDSIFTTASGLNEDKVNLAADITYQHNFRESSVFKLNGHITKFSLDRSQEASSNYFNPDNTFIRNFSFLTDAAQDITILTTQADLETNIGTVNLETGIKLSNIDSQSGIDFFNVTNGGRILDSDLSDNFLYDEEVYAGYVSLTKDWDKWSLKTGIRGEHTISSGNSIAASTINNLEYFELFPTFYLLYTLNENHNFSLDYSRKLDRPKYQDLNPFSYFLNEVNFNIGNPNLIPSFSHNLSFNYTLKDEYYFSVYYRDNGNYISTISFQDNINQTLRETKQNVLESTSYGFDFTVSKSITQNWFLYLYTSIFHEDETFLALESNAISYTNEVNGIYGSLSNYLTLSKDGTFTGELGLTYLSSFLSGSYVFSETTNLTLGLRKTLWDNRAVLSLVAEDILGQANPRLTSRYLNQDNSYFARPETQFIRVGFTYNFGNFRLGDNERSVDKKERDRL